MENGSAYDARGHQAQPPADGLWVLTVHNDEEPVRTVELALLDLRMRTLRVRNCFEASAALRDSAPPALVVTDISHPDGSWADVLRATRIHPPCAPVIVVSRRFDIKLCLDVMETGAYDFLVPPLASADLAFVVSGALLKGSHYRPQSQVPALSSL